MEDEKVIVVVAPYKVMLKEMLEKLNFSPAKYTSEKSGPDHSPSFMATVIFEDISESFMIDGPGSISKKEAENSAALQAIIYLKNTYNIAVKDVHSQEIEDVKIAMQDLHEAYEELKNKYEDSIEELNELKLTMNRRVIIEDEERVIEEDTRYPPHTSMRRTFARRDFPPGCGPNQY